MYGPNYTTGDEYDSPCEEYGCGFASHDRRCPHYQPPARPLTDAELKAEMDSLAECLICGKTVRFRELQATACCRACRGFP